jgi:hypothetical protein
VANASRTIPKRIIETLRGYAATTCHTDSARVKVPEVTIRSTERRDNDPPGGRNLARIGSATAKPGWIVIGRRVVVVSPETAGSGIVAIDARTAWSEIVRAGIGDDTSLFGVMHPSGAGGSTEGNQNSKGNDRTHRIGSGFAHLGVRFMSVSTESPWARWWAPVVQRHVPSPPWMKARGVRSESHGDASHVGCLFPQTRGLDA